MTNDEKQLLVKLTHGRWEDPEWGRRVENQLLLLKGLDVLAGHIASLTWRTPIQREIEKAKAAVSVGASTPDPIPPQK